MTDKKDPMAGTRSCCVVCLETFVTELADKNGGRNGFLVIGVMLCIAFLLTILIMFGSNINPSYGSPSHGAANYILCLLIFYIPIRGSFKAALAASVPRCPQCDSKDIIPARTPRGRRIIMQTKVNNQPK